MFAVAGQGTSVHAAASNDLHLAVVSAADGTTPVGAFEYLINLDNTGSTAGQHAEALGANGACSPTNGSYPSTCTWTSMGVPSSAPVVTQGTDADFANGKSITLPAGRYVISVRAVGFKLDGTHVTMPVDGTVTVPLQPTDPGLPAAQIQSAVFEDISPVNSAPDVPLEHGLAGFKGTIADYLGQVTTDVWGNPLCTQYTNNDNTQPIIGSGGNCLSKCYVVDNGIDIGTVAPRSDRGWGDGVTTGVCPTDPAGLTVVETGAAVPATAAIEGKIKIPNLGPNRYTLSVTPADGAGFVQTTTLEGNHDWDAWVMEGATGLDTEFVQGGEPFPAIIFGYVRPTALPASSATGEVKGVVDGVKVYYPPKGGTTQQGQIFGGLAGAKVDKPIDDAWVALTRLDGTVLDTAVYVGKANTDGTFDIKNVPDGTYTISWWDEAQNYIMDNQQMTVTNGELVDLGILPLNGWWTTYEGYVFNDTNRNGIKDPGEMGVPNFTLTMRKRENSLMDRGSTTVTTDSTGYYKFEGAYPMTQFYVMEAYNDRYYSTGATFQADNQPTPTTILADRVDGKFTGSGVDISTLPIIGLGGRLDWGVHTYDATGATGGVDPRNGGIVGTVSYDTTRNELDPRYAAVEDWQPGVSGLTVDLFTPVACGTTTTTRCDTTGRYELDANGAYSVGTKINTYVTEKWHQPTGCTARDIDGNALVHGTDENVLPVGADAPCLEGPLAGIQFENGWAEVDGNYGFGDGCVDSAGAPKEVSATDPANPTCDGGTFAPLAGGKDYLVRVEMPTDGINHRPLYNFTREEDVNIANGDTFVPAVPPSACAGALHTVDVAGDPSGNDSYAQQTLANGVTVPASTPVANDPFVGMGGSPYEGSVRPLCDTKLVTLANGKSVVPTFNVFTDVPLPGRFWGLIVDDLNFSTDSRSLLYGEKSGVPFAPVGIYDYTGRLVDTVESDFNGLWDVLMPSTNRINCPTPSGVCGNLYRFVGNDPGIPGQLNANYRPEYRTIAAEFEALPGLLVPADLAPTQVGVTVQLPGGQINRVACAADVADPQLFAVSKPYGNPGGSFTIQGTGFGTSPGNLGAVTLGGAKATVTSWAAESITVTIPAATTPGVYQLAITNSAGRTTVNGLTFHVIGAGYQPTIVEVGPGRTYAPANTLPATADHAIQRAIDAAPANALVVVYPGAAAGARVNPRGAYYENLIIDKPIKLQGVGPGGVTASGATVAGTIIDGGASAGDSAVAQDWQTKVGTLTWDGNQTVNDGADITILAHAAGNNAFPTSAAAQDLPRIDGIDLRGGDQQGFPTNINAIGGGATGQAPTVVTQGGAVFANAYARSLQLTNNVVENNGGGYGTLRFGTPELTGADPSNHNENIRIAHNRILQNAGTNLGGAIALFNGTDGYDIAANDICGNFSAEYGGGISHYGYSPNGRIHENRVYFNESYDEGAGIMIAGELPQDPTKLTKGAGPVDIYDNTVQANLSNDDGGGIRFLMAGNYAMNVYNNVVVNNVSAHEGGGISLNDAPAVRVFNNTIMKNMTTATAVTSNGLPAPAGLSTSDNSAQLQATLPVGSPTFSNPLLFNNIFWDNRAGTRAGATVTGLGQNGGAVNNWDLGNADGAGLLAPTSSILQTTVGTVADASNRSTDPGVVNTTDMGVSFQVWRNNPAFMGALLVAADLPPGPGDYHLASTSIAIDKGAASKAGVSAPAFDRDTFSRPVGAGFDIGADEYGNVPSVTDLSVTKTDNVTTVARGQQLTYTVTVANSGSAVAGAALTEQIPAGTFNSPLQNVTWTCAGNGAGNSCAAGAATSGNLANLNNVRFNLTANGSATLTVRATVNNNAALGTQITNRAAIAAPAGVTDTNPNNDSATDTDTVGINVKVAKTDNTTTAYTGARVTYSVVVAKDSTGAVNGIQVSDPVPAGLTNVTWTCSASGFGSSCGNNGGGQGTNAIARTVNLGNAANATVTYTVTGRVTATTGSITNTATITPPANVFDGNTADNTATDVDTIGSVPAAPALTVLDNFNRANATSLGANWQQLNFGGAAVRVNNNQAFGNNTGDAVWNPANAAAYGNAQAAGLTFTNTTLSGTGLYLRVTQTVPFFNTPSNYLLLTYNAGNGGSVSLSASGTNAGSIPVAFANGDTLTAATDASGTTVFVYKNGAFVGLLQAPASWSPAATGGRIGVRVTNNGRIDNFGGAQL